MKTLEGQPGKAINELDRTLAFVGLLFSLILTIWLAVTIDRPMPIIAGILSFLACAGYLCIRRNLYVSTIPSVLQMRASPRFYLVLNILFFLLFCYSILSIYLSPQLHTRPLGYFISTALMAAIVAVEILFLSPHKSRIYFVLFKIILIGLSLRWLQQLMFPSLVGMDPWWHEWFTLQILDPGHIPQGYAYSKLPVFHLITGAAMLITGLNYRMATMLSIGLLQVLCDTLFVFLLGRFILNAKVGLVAALLLIVAGTHIMFGLWTIPNTLGAILIFPIIYLLFKLRRDKPILAVCLSLLLMAVLILTHTIVAMCLAILLFVFWAALEVYARLYSEKPAAATTVTIAILFILFTVAMFGYWMYISGHITKIARLISGGFGWELWGHPFDELALQEVVQYMLDVPLSEQLFNSMGMFLFFALSFIGCFYFVSRKFGNRYSFAMVMAGVVILALAYLAPLFGRVILQGRWLYLATIMLAIPLGLALLLLCGVFKNKVARVGVMSLLVFPLCFLMIMNPMANVDNHVFSPYTGVRYFFTESELQAASTVSNMWDGKIGVDWDYRLPVLFHFNGELIAIGEHLHARDFTYSQDMLVLIRREIVNSPFRIRGKIFKLDYEPRDVLAEQRFSRIYETGSVSGFLKLQ